ncbi:MAG: ASCH domain-containing protein [Candidatus Blackburnbacteria bacterium]|nr:ASCH domain-containing protein [Candidatus Blackburnbacteria bacterium]
MKILKFSPELVPIILNGSKTSTWRLFDDKNLTEDDKLSLVNRETLKEFAKAKITSVKQTTFGKLTKEDKDGHESFKNDKKMYETYSHYYNCDINKTTPLKIIRFQLM